MKKRTMDTILIIVGISAFVFIVVMIWLYIALGSVPDSLVYTVIPALLGEAGIMGWIKTAKVKNREREWELEDRELELEHEKAMLEEAKLETQVIQEEENHQGTE